MEDDLQFAASTALKRMDRKPNDENKELYYRALARYEFVSKELGAESPAKLAEKARATQAAAAAALQELAGSLQKATSLQDVVKFLKKATKGTSPLPDLLKDARTNDVVQNALSIVAENAGLADRLAGDLLAAKN